MYRDKTVAVIIPAYNEEKLIGRVIKTTPPFVDHIVVVDDASTDCTRKILEDLALNEPRLTIIHHCQNKGSGAAHATAYLWCRDKNIDLVVGMDGDGQMDPEDLPALLDPIVHDRADYVKGNRLITGEAWQRIPKLRFLGNSVLTFLTKIASGYWHVTDSQSGYHALTKRALQMIPIQTIFPGYGWPNDLLVTLNIYGMRVMDVPVNPVYGIGEKSGFSLPNVVFPLFFLILRLFVKRMVQKYIVRDFHPLILFYTLGSVLFLLDIPLVIRLVILWGKDGRIPPINALAILFCTIIGFQSVLFGMLFDMEANRSLKGN
jgi:glycosyltransferase involved in cell wall biosynthesis